MSASRPAFAIPRSRGGAGHRARREPGHRMAQDYLPIRAHPQQPAALRVSWWRHTCQHQWAGRRQRQSAHAPLHEPACQTVPILLPVSWSAPTAAPCRTRRLALPPGMPQAEVDRLLRDQLVLKNVSAPVPAPCSTARESARHACTGDRPVNTALIVAAAATTNLELEAPQLVAPACALRSACWCSTAS